jgi:urate oxidase
VSKADTKVDNYIFITTDTIDEDVQEYARDLYRETGGIEFAILDCIGFVRHFLHLFHRLRTDFLEAYQQLVLDEPESAVSQPLKEVFLNLRRAAETDSSA